jgi:hypothetical protein
VCNTPGHGRSINLHPRQGLPQEVRALQASAAFAPYRTWCQVAEHRLARLVQLGQTLRAAGFNMDVFS